MGRVPAASSSAYNGLFAPNLNKGYVNTTDDFQPRFGLAYQVDPKMVIRLGAGRFVTRMGLLDNIFPGGNSPFQPFVTVTNVSVDQSWRGAEFEHCRTDHSHDTEQELKIARDVDVECYFAARLRVELSVFARVMWRTAVCTNGRSLT